MSALVNTVINLAKLAASEEGLSSMKLIIIIIIIIVIPFAQDDVITKE
jgi:hypothetical protein